MLQPTEVQLPRERSCGATARRRVEQFARGALADQGLDDLKLVVSELVDNAYLHGKGRIWLRLRHREDQIRIEVIDEGEQAAVNLSRSPTPDRGNGLRIVDQLATAWGAYERTTHVWAELRLAGAAR